MECIIKLLDVIGSLLLGIGTCVLGVGSVIGSNTAKEWINQARKMKRSENASKTLDSLEKDNLEVVDYLANLFYKRDAETTAKFESCHYHLRLNINKCLRFRDENLSTSANELINFFTNIEIKFRTFDDLKKESEKDKAKDLMKNAAKDYKKLYSEFIKHLISIEEMNG